MRRSRSGHKQFAQAVTFCLALPGLSGAVWMGALWTGALWTAALCTGALAAGHGGADTGGALASGPEVGRDAGPEQDVGAGVGAGSARAAELLAALRDPDHQTWRRSERALLAEWARSGSAAMDLLLARGREALGAGDTDTAIGHFSALIDHAPDFAEGWNARATAFYAAGDLGRSASDIARVLALNPDHFGALAGLGLIWTELDEPARALAAYRAALAIHPHKPEFAEAVEQLESQISGPEL